MPDYSNPQTLNRYAYVMNNPMKYVDPSGHDIADWFDDSWKQEFRDVHGYDPGAGDYAYRFGSMSIASGMDKAGDAISSGFDTLGDLAASLPSVEYSEGAAALGRPDDDLTRALSGVSEALDWAALTVVTGSVVTAGLLAVSGVGLPAAAAFFTFGGMTGLVLGGLSAASSGVANLVTQRTGVSANVSENSLDVEIRVGVDSAVSFGSTIAGGIAGRTVARIGGRLAADAALNASEVGYDRARANGLVGLSRYHRLSTRW